MSGPETNKKFSVEILVYAVGTETNRPKSSSGSKLFSGSKCSNPSNCSRTSDRSGSIFSSSGSKCSSSSNCSGRSARSGNNFITEITENLFKNLKLGALHSAILYDDKWEIHFGDDGIHMVRREPNSAEPLESEILGFTDKDFTEIMDIIDNELAEIFNTNTYDLIKNNCHHFCNEFTKRTLDREIPTYLTQLPKRTGAFGAFLATAGATVGALAAGAAVVSGTLAAAPVGLAAGAFTAVSFLVKSMSK